MKVLPERNEYLTTIFKLKESNKKVTNKALSQALDIAPSSVTEMVKKLKKDGLLKDQKTIDLSQDGEDYAKDIVSKHRLWEYFLTENLKYNNRWKYCGWCRHFERNHRYLYHRCYYRLFYSYLYTEGGRCPYLYCFIRRPGRNAEIYWSRQNRWQYMEQRTLYIGK